MDGGQIRRSVLGVPRCYAPPPFHLREGVLDQVPEVDSQCPSSKARADGTAQRMRSGCGNATVAVRSLTARTGFHWQNSAQRNKGVGFLKCANSVSPMQKTA